MTDEMFRDLFDNVVICGRYPAQKLEAMKSYITTLNIELKSVKSENEKLYQENILLKKAIKEAVDFIKEHIIETEYRYVYSKTINVIETLELNNAELIELLQILERTDK